MITDLRTHVKQNIHPSDFVGILLLNLRQKSVLQQCMKQHAVDVLIVLG